MEKTVLWFNPSIVDEKQASQRVGLKPGRAENAKAIVRHRWKGANPSHSRDDGIGTEVTCNGFRDSKHQTFKKNCFLLFSANSVTGTPNLNASYLAKNVYI